VNAGVSNDDAAIALVAKTIEELRFIAAPSQSFVEAPGAGPIGLHEPAIRARRTTGIAGTDWLTLPLSDRARPLVVEKGHLERARGPHTWGEWR
jgi:hypothetical protein